MTMKTTVSLCNKRVTFNEAKNEYIFYEGVTTIVDTWNIPVELPTVREADKLRMTRMLEPLLCRQLQKIRSSTNEERERATINEPLEKSIATVEHGVPTFR